MESSAQTLVNTVNCVGVMGKGVAQEFKVREPAMFAAYKKLCERKALSLPANSGSGAGKEAGRSTFRPRFTGAIHLDWNGLKLGWKNSNLPTIG